jgi:hypothetical protein
MKKFMKEEAKQAKKRGGDEHMMLGQYANETKMSLLALESDKKKKKKKAAAKEDSEDSP